MGKLDDNGNYASKCVIVGKFIALEMLVNIINGYMKEHNDNRQVTDIRKYLSEMDLASGKGLTKKRFYDFYCEVSSRITKLCDADRNLTINSKGDNSKYLEIIDGYEDMFEYAYGKGKASLAISIPEFTFKASSVDGKEETVAILNPEIYELFKNFIATNYDTVFSCGGDILSLYKLFEITNKSVALICETLKTNNSEYFTEAKLASLSKYFYDRIINIIVKRGLVRISSVPTNEANKLYDECGFAFVGDVEAYKYLMSGLSDNDKNNFKASFGNNKNLLFSLNLEKIILCNVDEKGNFNYLSSYNLQDKEQKVRIK